LTSSDAARLLQVGELEAKDRLDTLGVGPDALFDVLKRDPEGPKRGPSIRWLPAKRPK